MPDLPVSVRGRNTFFGAGIVFGLALEPIYLKEPHITVGGK